MKIVNSQIVGDNSIFCYPIHIRVEDTKYPMNAGTLQSSEYVMISSFFTYYQLRDPQIQTEIIKKAVPYIFN